MEYQILRGLERGTTLNRGFKSFHSFSFDSYINPNRKRFGYIRVINEDMIKSNSGFDMHPHSNMEIITYMIEGSLQHKDSLGNSQIIKQGDIQYMRAGSGISHSEINPDKQEICHLLQIWILPKEKNLTPFYQRKSFIKEDNKNKLNLLCSYKENINAININQKVEMYNAILEKDYKIIHKSELNNKIWIQVVKGSLRLYEEILHQGDAIAIKKVDLICLEALKNSELILLEML